MRDTREIAKEIVSKLTIEEKLQMFVNHVEVERLNLPSIYFGGEAAHGLQARSGQGESYEPTKSTSFTQPIGMAASFDKELIKEAGDVVGTEVRAFYNMQNKSVGIMRWAPTVDLCRDPRWGRNEEGYGEDPYLTGKMAGAYIEGMQDEHNYDGSEIKAGERGDRIRVGTTLKHFYANNVEWRRCADSVDVPEKVKYDYELEPYRYCIEDSHAEAVMTAYNGVNGTTCILNDEVSKILKDKWGLKHAVCDYGAFTHTVTLHKDFDNYADTFAVSVKAGVDNMLDNAETVHNGAVEAYKRGLITEAEIDKSLICMFDSRVRTGEFDEVDPYAQLGEKDLGTEHATNIAKKMAVEANVLLKNNGILPLSKEDNLVLIGPWADSWYQDWYCGLPMYEQTIKQGMEEAIGRKIQVESTHNVIRLKCGDKYVGADEGVKPKLILVDNADDAVLLTHMNWGSGSHLFHSEKYNKFVRLNEDGSLSLETEKAFQFFVLENLTIASANGANILEDPRNANQIEFDKYWEGDEEEIIIYGFGTRPVFVKDNELKSVPFVRDAGSLEGQISAKKSGQLEDKPVIFTVEIVENGVENAKKLAGLADKVILALGANPVINAKEEIDRKSIEMIDCQNKLFEEIVKINPNVVVVLMTNYPYAIGNMNEKAAAILTSATGAQDMGYAVASAIFGESSPAGRLPMTWYKSDEDLPPMTDYDIINQPRTYRYFNKPVLYPFGYGLTYGTFAYNTIEAAVNEKKEIEVTLSISRIDEVCENKSIPEGIDEVVQVYIKRISESQTIHPIRRLVGFERIHNVKPGETRNVQLKINSSDISIYMENEGVKKVEPGEYLIYAGKNALDEAVSVKVDI